MGNWGIPEGGFAWCALVGAVLVWFALRRPRWREAARAIAEDHYWSALLGLCGIAAVLSTAYAVYYLRGGPRIIDATAYWQQARIFATGHLTALPFEPSAASRGRFLYFEPLHRTLSVLFPPGYAAVLSLGALVGAPLLVGPVLAALLVWATAETTRRVFQRRDAALLAGLLSATTMALRYHTADTMSHGLAALLVASAIAATLGNSLGSGAVAGLALGWLVATRPVTGAMLIAMCLLYRLRHEQSLRWLSACGVGILPGCTFWLIYQWASTGSLWQATQLAYYAVADGPPGCFRYGFGKGIGCVFEHGAYIENRLPNGYGLWQATYVTLLRLRWHCLDVHNFEPLILVPILALNSAARSPKTRLLLLSTVGVVAGYLPFYFDASYPGGGARLLVDIIPLEHVLVAGWLIRTEWTQHFIPLSLVGFALHGSFEHAKLRDRDGGRPMFEPEVLARAQMGSGVVFVDTDHGFLLGHDPNARDAHHGIVVLRQHGDAHDRLAWEHLGRPDPFRYHFDPTRPNAQATVERIAPEQLSALRRFEAEAEWPAMSVAQGWVRPVFPPNDCTSARRGLALEPSKGASNATLALYAEESGLHRLELGLVARQTGLQELTLTVGGHTFKMSVQGLAHQCLKVAFERVELKRGEQLAVFDTGATGIVLDYWQID